jgi:aldehyde:ferredoxin oxidoreductase
MTLEKMFNACEEAGRKEDCLPKRLTNKPLPDGPNAGKVVPMEDLLDEGSRAQDWDKTTAIPLKEILQELDLSELIE